LPFCLWRDAGDLHCVTNGTLVYSKLTCSGALAFLGWLTAACRCGKFPHLIAQSHPLCDLIRTLQLCQFGPVQVLIPLRRTLDNPF
jgi:hypothetical protein